MSRIGFQSDIVSQVKMQLMNRIGTGNAHQEKVARELAMSRATLHRKLNAKGKTFRTIRDEVIYQIATTALVGTDSRISEIALRLGFSEISSFDHAFRRISGGLSPSEFRSKIIRG